jgi:hypothetical protein
MWVCNTKAVGTTFPTVSTVVGCSLTWTISTFTRITFTTSGVAVGLNLCVGVGTATTGTIAITNNNATSAGTLWTAAQLTNADPTTPLIPGHVIGSTTLTNQTSIQTLTLPNTPVAGNAIFACVAHEANEDITAGANYSITGSNKTNMTLPTMCLQYQYALGTLSTTVDGSWTTSSGYMAAAGEIAAAPSGSPVGFIPI